VKETIYRRHSLGDLGDPWLKRSLRAWYRMSDSKGRFHLAGNLDPILSNKDLLLPASTLFLVEGSNPQDYVILRQGPQARMGLGKNLTGCRLGDYADRDYVVAVGDELDRTVKDPDVVYHEVLAAIAGRTIHYDRLTFPIFWHGMVDQILTVVRWRSPIWH
jgi:hypothetical protein